MATTILGKVMVTPKGAWSGSASYEVLDIVTNSGNSYIAKKGVPSGIALTNTDYWLKIAEKGEKGDTGVSIDSVELNDDYTLTINFDNGTSTTTASIRGEQGNGITSISKTGTSGNVDTYTITFDDGDTSTFTVTNGSVTSVNGKTGAVTGLAEYDGYYDTLSVGLADNLIDRKGNGNEQSFTFRTSCGDDSIADDGSGIVQSIKGNTMVWNQLVENGNFESSSGWAPSPNASVSVANNKCTYEITGGEGSYKTLSHSLAKKIIVGHKYFVGGKIKVISIGNANCNVSLVLNNGSYQTVNHKQNVVEGTTYDMSSIQTLLVDGPYGKVYAYLPHNNSSVGDTFEISNVMVIDLTVLFGAGNEPSTVEEFKALFPLDYYDYDAGSLLSYNGTGIRTNGFNQWDEEWESGYYDTLTGRKLSDNDCKRSKNMIPVLPNMTYYVRYDLNYNIRCIFYDADKKFISSSSSLRNATITSPQNAYYMTFYTRCYTSDIYGHVNINLSWSGYRNGEYEPYWTRPLNFPIAQYFPTGMKSVGTVYDELTKDKAVKRIESRAYQSGDENDTSVVTDGTTTYYPLAEPIETTITPPLDLTYKVADFGTEQSLPENTSVPTTTPLKAVIKYSDDYTRMLATLSKQYDTTDGLDGLLSALATMLGSALDGTVTITRGAYDSSTKKYAWTCTFTSNE